VPFTSILMPAAVARAWAWRWRSQAASGRSGSGRGGSGHGVVRARRKWPVADGDARGRCKTTRIGALSSSPPIPAAPAAASVEPSG
jgi:hypothetical protein